MALLRDEVVTELYDEETNYFDLSDEIHVKARKMAMVGLLSQEPTWFVQFRTWGLSLMDDSEKSESVVKTFVRDLISHRVTTIWQNQKAATKRKARGGGGDVKRQRTEKVGNCDRCQGKKQWCCLPCELAKLTTVFTLLCFL